jgi:hypothetical protein
VTNGANSQILIDWSALAAGSLEPSGENAGQVDYSVPILLSHHHDGLMTKSKGIPPITQERPHQPD